MNLAILNVGAGDTKLSFDPSNPAEVERAKRIVKDMLSRGYAILVVVGEKDGKPLYQRATGFDPQTCEYLIFGTPDEPAVPAEPEQEPVKVKPIRRRGVRRVPAANTEAVAVARTAGG